MNKVRNYDQEMPQSHTADQPTARRGRGKEQLQQQHKSKATGSLFPSEIYCIKKHKQWEKQ